MSQPLPEFTLFGASMTEWSFDEQTEGLGWFLEKKYRDKVRVKNEEFVLFGDSLTEWNSDEEHEGFGWALEQKHQSEARTLNEGQAGYTRYTSTRLRSNFDRIINRATSPGAPKTLLFTIFMGANDACFFGDTELVPLPVFEANIRSFVETILTQDDMSDTKIILITPPPINIPSPEVRVVGDDKIEELNSSKRKQRGYRTYMNKKRYAEKIIQIAAEYEETGRVIGLDFWGELVRTRLREVKEDYDENKLPGSGLYGTKDFDDGYFTDGLHPDKKGYNVLSKAFYESMLAKWPEMAPDKL